MQVTKELIEKYHNGECSPEEQLAVENWLMDDEEDEFLPLTETEKHKHMTDMWAEISSVLPSEKQPKIFSLKKILRSERLQIAAALFLVGFGASVLMFSKNNTEKTGVIAVSNASDTSNKNLDQSKYTIALGPKSNVEINSQTGMIDFCGAMMINAKQDMEFTIQGTCANPSDNSEKVTLKKGLNYIALNYASSPDANEVIIFEEGSMMGLPPLVMKQLMHQFNI